jgi:hypothetical protein
VIEKHCDFFQMIELCAGLNEYLVSGRGSSALHIDDLAYVQSRGIDAVLSGSHYIVADFYFLET